MRMIDDLNRSVKGIRFELGRTLQMKVRLGIAISFEESSSDSFHPYCEIIQLFVGIIFHFHEVVMSKNNGCTDME